MTLDTIDDLQALDGWLIYRHAIASKAGALNPKPLIPGTESHAYRWLENWHQNAHNWVPCDVACYSVPDAVVSGAGNIWIGGRLVTSPEVMPPYVADVLGIATGGNEGFHAERRHSTRLINRPCLVAVGHDIRVYGHFLIEMLFRILVAQKAFQRSGMSYGILLDQSALPWLLAILENDLGIPPSEFEFFDATRERVLLRHGLVSSRVFIGERIHPYANDLLESLLTELAPPSSPIRRAFITLGHFRNSAAPNRICVNEGALAAIARNYGFTPITPEDLIWR